MHLCMNTKWYEVIAIQGAHLILTQLHRQINLLIITRPQTNCTSIGFENVIFVLRENWTTTVCRLFAFFFCFKTCIFIDTLALEKLKKESLHPVVRLAKKSTISCWLVKICDDLDGPRSLMTWPSCSLALVHKPPTRRINGMLSITIQETFHKWIHSNLIYRINKWTISYDTIHY